MSGYLRLQNDLPFDRAHENELFQIHYDNVSKAGIVVEVRAFFSFSKYCMSCMFQSLLLIKNNRKSLSTFKKKLVQ